jgi:hypothetical protein
MLGEGLHRVVKETGNFKMFSEVLLQECIIAMEKDYHHPECV